MKDKKQVFDDFINMIKESWTYGKMTTSEKEKCLYVLSNNRTLENIKGNYNQRWKALNVIYFSFLSGIGYNNYNWRENDEL